MEETPDSASAPRDQAVTFFIGVVSLLIQVTLIRQLLSVLSGNEIEIGITLAGWLLFYGAGSLAGGRWQANRLRLAASFLGAAVLIFPTVAVVRGVRPILGIPPGELLSFGTTLWVTIVTIAPLALVSGLQYPFAVALLADREHAGPRTYTLETLGFFSAGLFFAFVLSTRVDAVLLATAVSCLLISVAGLLLKRPAMLALLALPISAYLLWGSGVRALPYAPFALEELRESRYGELALVKSGQQLSLFWSGQFLYPVSDAQSDETAIHVAMSLHAEPAGVLVIGDAPARLPEFLKYPGMRVTYIIEDPTLYAMLRSYKETGLLSASTSPSVTILQTEARRFLRDTRQRWDIVFLDMAPPATAAGNRFFTLEFFREIRRVLKPGGIFALRAMQGHGYLSPSATRVNQSVRNALERVFPEVVATSLEYGLVAASDRPVDTVPETLIRRFADRNVATRFVETYIFRDAFSSQVGPASILRTPEEFGKAVMNTDRRPVAYLFNLLHWAELQKSRLATAVLHTGARELVLLAGAVFLTAGALCSGARNPAVYLSTFSTGFVSLSLSMTLVLGFQAYFGHAYEAIALLTSAFMVGACLGSHGSLRLPQTHVLRYLAGVEFVLLLLCLGLPLLPHVRSAFYAANMTAGILTGTQFSLATRSLNGGDQKAAAAKLYGLDMVGSSAGALIAATVIVPVAGLSQTFLMLGLIKGASLIALLRQTSSSR